MDNFCERVGVKRSTFQYHVKKPRAESHGGSRKEGLDPRTGEFLLPLILRSHRAKEPLSVKEIIECACRLNPGKTENACKMWYSKVFRPKHAGVLSKPSKAQETNTNRASIGYHEIVRWSETASQALEIQMELNRNCLLYTSPSPRDLSTSRMPSSA